MSSFPRSIRPARSGPWSKASTCRGSKRILKARGSEPGRAATDPKILVALWLWAATQGVGSARELDRLCQEQGAYRWLCGGVSLNYHTLSDFRVGHQAALDHLFTQVLAILLHEGVVQVRRISQDGTRVRASAGASSYRRKATLERTVAWRHASRWKP